VESLREFLTTPRWNRETLFADIQAVAEDIVKDPGFAEYRKAASLASYISQVSSTAKAASEHLENALKAAVVRKTKRWNARDRQRCAADLLKILNDLRQHRRPPRLAETEAALNTLLATAQAASLHFIVASMTAEQSGNAKGDQLSQILIERLGLKASASVAPEQMPVFIFCLPKRHGSSFWRSLFRKVQQAQRFESEDRQWPSAKIATRLEELNKAAHLQVCEIAPIACLCPVVLYDPRTPERAAFNLYYFREGLTDTIACTKIPADYLDLLETELYQRFFDNDEALGIIPVLWANCKERILRGL